MRHIRKYHTASEILLDFIILFIILVALAYGALKMVMYREAYVRNEIRRNHIKTVELALEAFYQDHRVFPLANSAPVNAEGKKIEKLKESKNAIESLYLSGNLAAIPKDPEPEFRYIYIVANDDNFTGGKKLQRYALYALKENELPDFSVRLVEAKERLGFISAGNAPEQFEMNLEEYNELMLGDTNIPRKDGEVIVEPKGGEATHF